MNYEAFLATKTKAFEPIGLTGDVEINPQLFPFQRDIVRWALRRGRAAIFSECGTGKTAMQLEWAKNIPGDVLILCPLAVAAQTVREGEKFGVPVTYARKHEDIAGRITITNYEMLDRFDVSRFSGIVLDESSCIKAYDSKTRSQIIEAFSDTPYRLACTATPAPNDYMELGNHAEFLGAMSRVEMLSMYFVHDGGETQKWRLKGHAQKDFWKWICSWAMMLRKPSDLGYADDGFVLPDLVLHNITVDYDRPMEGELFPRDAATLQDRIAARRDTIDARVADCAAIVNESEGQFIVWCNLNSESEAIRKLVPGSVEVKGSDSQEYKEQSIIKFAAGEIRVLISKPVMFGFGLNLQNCSQMAFLGLSDSYEQYYQAVRRCWRFGQKNTVDCYVITSSIEGAVVANIKRKELEATQMADEMTANMRDLNAEDLHGQTKRNKDSYDNSKEMTLPSWIARMVA